MEHAAKPRSAEQSRQPAAERVFQPGEVLTFAGSGPATVAQRALREAIEHSPRIVAQRALIASIRDGSSATAPDGRTSKSDGDIAQLAGVVSGQWRLPHLRNPPTPTVQRVIKVGTDTFTHASRRINALHSEVVVPHLEKNDFKSYGIKSQLVAYIREHNINFADASEFLGAFMTWLAGRERKTKGDKTTPVLKKFTVTGLSRPTWSGDLKTKLGFGAGDNIRHVIRNASLKRALEVEYGKYTADPPARKRRMIEIGNAVGVSTDGETVHDITKKVYDTVYLNEANLFSGQGPYNQIIGFSADRVEALGQSLVDEDEMVDPVATLKAVSGLIETASRQANIPVPNPVTDDLNAILQEMQKLFINPINQRPFDFVQGAEIGDLITDIGINFGFDMIDGRVASDQQDHAERQKKLVLCEMQLRAFTASAGTEGNLASIFSEFLAITRN